MASQDEGQKVCIEIADLPRDDLAWLSDTAAAIEGAIGEELPTAFGWHRVEAASDINGVRILFELATPGDGSGDTVPETLMGIVRRVITGRSGPDRLAA